jgi:hypothetical protein
MPLSLLLKLMLTLAPAGTVMLFLSKVKCCAVKFTVTGPAAAVAAGGLADDTEVEAVPEEADVQAATVLTSTNINPAAINNFLQNLNFP